MWDVFFFFVINRQDQITSPLSIHLSGGTHPRRLIQRWVIKTRVRVNIRTSQKKHLSLWIVNWELICQLLVTCFIAPVMLGLIHNHCSRKDPTLFPVGWYMGQNGSETKVHVLYNVVFNWSAAVMVCTVF